MNAELLALHEENVNFVKDALYTHARQVENFCQAEQSRAAAGVANANRDAKGQRHARRLVSQLEQLIKTARGSEALVRSMNLEVLEARAERLAELLDDAENPAGCEVA